MELENIPNLSNNVFIETDISLNTICISNAFGKYNFGTKESEILQLMINRIPLGEMCEITDQSPENLKDFFRILDKYKVLKGNKTGWIRLTPIKWLQFFDVKRACIVENLWQLITIIVFFEDIKNVSALREALQNITKYDISIKHIFSLLVIGVCSVYIHELGHLMSALKHQCSVAGIFVQYRQPLGFKTVVTPNYMYKMNKFRVDISGIRNNLFMLVFVVLGAEICKSWNMILIETFLINCLLIISNTIPIGDTDGNNCLKEMRRWINECCHKDGEC